MFTVREVLDRLPGTTLVPLSRERGLVISGVVEDFRVGLAKHYGRRVADLLRDLRRSDLGKLFRRPIELDGVTYKLHNRGTFSKAELLEIALSLFARGEAHEALSALVFDDEDQDEDEEGDDDSEEEDDDSEEGDEDEEPPPEVQAILSTLRNDRWSTPRPLPRLLSLLYGRSFERLRTARFQRLLSDLQAYGIEVSLANSSDDEALDLDAESPGLDAMLKLRLRAEEETADEEVDADDIRNTPSSDAEESEGLPGAVLSLLEPQRGEVWGPPRTIVRLLKMMYDREFTRLRAERFARLVSDLADGGVELCFDDDPDEQPIAPHTDPPRLDAKVRLRRKREAPPPVKSGSTVPPRTASPMQPPQRAEPPAPAPTVRVVPDPVNRVGPVPTARLTPYDLSLLRLEFLTAAPCAGRARDPMWPEAFLDAATRGIDLDDRSRRFLRLAANTFVSGSHDPMVRVTRLTRTLHAEEWPLLLIDFERLNPDADPDLVASVVRHASELASIHMEPTTITVQPSAPPPSDERPRQKPAVDRRSAARSQDHSEPGGERNLGALKGMFDD